MIFVNFDLEVLRAQLTRDLVQTVTYLEETSNKTFVIVVDGIEYSVDYELRGTRLEFFAQAPSSLPNLARPTTRFNIGAFLLPEAMTPEGKIVYPSDFVATPQVIVHDTNPEISLEIQQKIMEQIKKRGFLNLIHKN